MIQRSTSLEPQKPDRGPVSIGVAVGALFTLLVSFLPEPWQRIASLCGTALGLWAAESWRAYKTAAFESQREAQEMADIQGTIEALRRHLREESDEDRIDYDPAIVDLIQEELSKLKHDELEMITRRAERYRAMRQGQARR